MDSAAESESLLTYYRRAIEGHVYIRETIDAMLDVVEARVRQLGGAPRVLELGSHAGVITEMLLDRCPGIQVIVSDDNDPSVAVARRRLNGCSVEFRPYPVTMLPEPVDLAISVARHHHLPHDYLDGLRQVMKRGSSYILADELCPEYCQGDRARRIEWADLIHVAGGHVLTSRAEVEAFEAHGTIPQAAVEIEQARRRALWRWYRFVVDESVERGYFDIAAGELQSAHDDLITGSDAEHKLSPLIVERQLSLAGFRQRSRRLVGPADDPERQSMFVYEYELI